VPLKFSLYGYQGDDVVASTTSQRIACQVGASEESVEEIAQPGASGLTYDAGSDVYGLVWKTDAAWRGTCRALSLTLSDGTTHTATFNFRS
jgi:hypothetical protein